MSFALTVAVLATFLSGHHRDVGLRPARASFPERPMPSVSQSAIERGCAAWGESLGECLISGGDPYMWGKPDKF
jgi:hypothetical protein